LRVNYSFSWIDLVVLKRTVQLCLCSDWSIAVDLSTFTTDATSQLDVLWHDGDTLGVDGAQVGVFEETDQVGLAGFLQSHDGGRLETQVGLEILSNFTNQTLEWQLADQELGRLLVATDFTESDGTGAITMRLLDASSCWCRFTGSLGGQLFAWCLSTS
jgi:hypothetical protein